MIINTTIPLKQANDYPSRQVGKYAHDFGKIINLKTKTSNGFIIPTETIKKIAHHNNLIEKVKLMEETNDWDSELLSKKLLGKIRRLIKKQDFPEEVSHDLIKSYHKLAGKDKFIKITDGKNTVSNIKGEANFLESLLELWGKLKDKSDLISTSFLVLEQFQADSSCIVRPDQNKKGNYLIKAVHGSFDLNELKNEQPDIFEINITHGTITSRHLHPRKHLLKRKLDGYQKVTNKNKNKASLEDKLAIEVAKITHTLNQRFVGQIQTEFSLVKNKIILTGLSKVDYDNLTENSNPILIGQSVTGGFVEGYVQIVNNSIDKHNFETGHILVKKNLSHLDLGLITHASAIILEEKKLTPTVLGEITKNHIPCVIGVIDARKRLSNNNKIVVDTGSGKIFPGQKKEEKDNSIKTITKILLSAGNPFRTNSYQNHSDGVFLKSDYAVAFIGIHPNHLIKNKTKLFDHNLERTINTFFTKEQEQLFYRSCNLNSLELKSLANSLNYEQDDLSPYIGTRGAIRTLQDSTLFEKELELVAKYADINKRNVNFVIPFVRTTAELALIFKIIEKVISKNSYLKFWLQLNTPANVTNLKEFLHLPIEGVTVQAKTIHDLSYGLDPDNPELLRQYSFDTSLVKNIISQVVDTIKSSHHIQKRSIGNLPVVVKLNQYNSELVDQSVRLGVRAIVVKPPLLDIVKQQIITTESERFSHS